MGVGVGLPGLTEPLGIETETDGVTEPEFDGDTGADGVTEADRVTEIDGVTEPEPDGEIGGSYICH